MAEKIARIKVRPEAALLLLYRLAPAKGQRWSTMPDVAVAKLSIREAAVQSGLEAVRLHGDHDYTIEVAVERDVRDALGGFARLLGL